MKHTKHLMIICAIVACILAGVVYRQKYNQYKDLYYYHENVEMYHLRIYDLIIKDIEEKKAVVVNGSPFFRYLGLIKYKPGHYELQQAQLHREMKRKYLNGMKRPWLSVD